MPKTGCVKPSKPSIARIEQKERIECFSFIVRDVSDDSIAGWLNNAIDVCHINGDQSGFVLVLRIRRFIYGKLNDHSDVFQEDSGVCHGNTNKVKK